MPSRSQLWSPHHSHQILAPLEFLNPLRVLMACAVVNEFGILPRRLFRPSSKQFQLALISQNHKLHIPFFVSTCLYAQHIPRVMTHLGSLVHIRVCRHQSLMIWVHSCTFQGISTPGHTKRPGQLKRSSPHTQISHYFCLTITSGRWARASLGMIEIHYRP